MSDSEVPAAGVGGGRSLCEGAAWIAGEASGDYLASLVLPRLSEVLGGAPQFGVGGPKMAAAGLDCWYPSERLAVRGYVEVIKKLPGIVALRRDMLRRVSAARPRVFIGVDAPDFNLGVEIKLKARGIPTVHFVSPSIWAWRPERIWTVQKATDIVLLIFPFEEEIYRRAGVPAVYIGHPLAGIIPMQPDPGAARAELGIDPGGEPLFAVLPGSRVDEVSGCGPIFFEACERVVRRLGGAGRFVLPAVDAVRGAQIREVARRYPLLSERLTIVAGRSHRDQPKLERTAVHHKIRQQIQAPCGKQQLRKQRQQAHHQQTAPQLLGADSDVSPQGDGRWDQDARRGAGQGRDQKGIEQARVEFICLLPQPCQIGLQRPLHDKPSQQYQDADRRADDVPPLEPDIGLLRAVEQLPDVGVQGLRQVGQGLDVRLGLACLPGGHRLPGHVELFRQGVLGQLLPLAQPLQILSHCVHKFRLPVSAYHRSAGIVTQETVAPASGPCGGGKNVIW